MYGRKVITDFRIYRNVREKKIYARFPYLQKCLEKESCLTSKPCSISVYTEVYEEKKSDPISLATVITCG